MESGAFRLHPREERGTSLRSTPLAEGRGQSIGPESLVRISSITKPIAAAAAMVLIERGQLGMDDPIETFIPELVSRRVLRRIDAALFDTEPARRSITARHLLTCTIGFGFPMTAGPHPVMEEARLQLGLDPQTSKTARYPPNGYAGSPHSR